MHSRSTHQILLEFLQFGFCVELRILCFLYGTSWCWCICFLVEPCGRILILIDSSFLCVGSRCFRFLCFNIIMYIWVCINLLFQRFYSKIWNDLLSLMADYQYRVCLHLCRLAKCRVRTLRSAQVSTSTSSEPLSHQIDGLFSRLGISCWRGNVKLRCFAFLVWMMFCLFLLMLFVVYVIKILISFLDILFEFRMVLRFESDYTKDSYWVCTCLTWLWMLW